MGLVADLTPTNINEEKQRFLADPVFNPQFKYKRKFSTEELHRYGFPRANYAEHAEKILVALLNKYSPEEILEQRGALLPKETVTKTFKDFLREHGLEDKFKIKWSKNYVSRTLVTSSYEIRMRLPAAVREKDLTGLIYHEVGTHALRRINYVQQPWYKHKKRYGFAPYLKTEEGLAAIHSCLPKHDFSDQTLKNVTSYLAVKKAQEGSFMDVWQLVSSVIADPETAFSITARQKRGLTDTSQPGGFTKDLVYFEGFVDTLLFLIHHDFPIKELYFGKLAAEDIDRAVSMNPRFQPLLPSFYTEDPANYRQQVEEIAQLHFVI